MSSDNKDNPKSHFIKSFEIKNFRGIIESRKIEIPANTQWIFLTGENGFGKTSVLQALAAGLFGKNKIKKKINTHSKIEITLQNGNIYKGISQGEGSTPFEQVIAYGSSRLNMTGGSIAEAERPNAIDSLFDTLVKLENIEEELIRWYRDDKKKYPESKKKLLSVKKALVNLLNIQDITIVDKRNTQIVKYHEKDLEGKTYYVSDFNDLAAGYRNIIATIGDTIIRLFRTQSDITEIKHLQGIVIIDEFDLHLHPKWQKRLVSELSTLFPNVQFVASTHSVIPLLGTVGKSTCLKVSRHTKERGIKVENLDYVDIKNLTPNTILTSPIFDFEELIPESHLEKERLRTEETYKQVKINDETKAFLKNVAQKLKKGKKA